MKRHSLLSALAWLAGPVPLMAAEAGGGAAATNPPVTPAPATNPPAVDAAAIERAGFDKAQAQFAGEFKAATGFDSLEAFKKNQLETQGKFQELAESSADKAQKYQAKFQQAAISAALSAAAVDAVDPETVGQLLAGRCAVDDDGHVTIDGKPVAAAVKQLLADKPFLAKAQGGPGSGAPQAPRGDSPAAATLNPLNPLERLKAARQAGAN